jgi:hypothetical protein
VGASSYHFSDKKHLVVEALARRGSIRRLEYMHAKENKIDDISHMQH